MLLWPIWPLPQPSRDRSPSLTVQAQDNVLRQPQRAFGRVSFEAYLNNDLKYLFEMLKVLLKRVAEHQHIADLARGIVFSFQRVVHGLLKGGTGVLEFEWHD